MEYLFGLAMLIVVISWWLHTVNRRELDQLKHKINFLEQKVDSLSHQMEMFTFGRQWPKAKTAEGNPADRATDEITKSAVEISDVLTPPTIARDERIPTEAQQIETQEHDEQGQTVPTAREILSVAMAVPPKVQAPPLQRTEKTNVTELVPSFLERVLHWLISGNPMLKIGVVILFF